MHCLQTPHLHTAAHASRRRNGFSRPAQQAAVGLQRLWRSSQRSQHVSQLHVARPDPQAPVQTQDSESDDVPSTSSWSGNDTTTLFDGSHVGQWSLPLALYFPFGLTLAAFRSGLWILGILIDAPWFRNQHVVNTYLSLLGVTVTWRHLERLPAQRHVMVSNHVTVGDLMFLFTAPRRYVHLVTTALPGRITTTRNLPVLLRPASPAAYDQLAASSDPAPLHLFPEGGMTNGRGMLRFSRGFMRLVQQGDLPVVPVALRVTSPQLDGVNTHTLLSSFLANLFWFSFRPTTVMEVTVLPPMQPAPGEGRGAFVRRVQDAIAAELGVPVADLTIQQKRQLMQAAKGLNGTR